MISFVKYHGTGNDFILIDDRKSKLDLSTETIRGVCNRHLGIGADGLILIRDKPPFDFDMLYYNSDGQRGSMCGNGGRCAVAFAHSLGMIGDSTEFNAFDGPHKAKVIGVNPFIVTLQMADVGKVEANEKFIFLDTGSPHYVSFTEDASSVDVVTEGRKIRYSPRFNTEGTNVNFVQVKNNYLSVRTYERGVEDETLSCGTGVTASVIAASNSGFITGTECDVETPGGKLTVYFKKNGNEFSDIWLQGNAVPVFRGQV
jgi:diaminopimelate epimerase